MNYCSSSISQETLESLQGSLCVLQEKIKALEAEQVKNKVEIRRLQEKVLLNDEHVVTEKFDSNTDVRNIEYDIDDEEVTYDHDDDNDNDDDIDSEMDVRNIEDDNDDDNDDDYVQSNDSEEDSDTCVEEVKWSSILYDGIRNVFIMYDLKTRKTSRNELVSLLNIINFFKTLKSILPDFVWKRCHVVV